MKKEYDTEFFNIKKIFLRNEERNKKDAKEIEEWKNDYTVKRVRKRTELRSIGYDGK